MGLKKYIKNVNILLLLIVMIFSVNAVNVVQDTGTSSSDEGIQAVLVTLFTIGIVGFLFIVFLLAFAWVLIKIWKMLTAFSRKEDFLFKIFEDNLNQCHINHDSKMKKRNWKFIWVFFKRQPIFLKNKKGELEQIGLYHGECLKKEGFYFLALTNKVSMFQTLEQIIVLPLTIKDKAVDKVDINGKRTIIINCEGVDQLENTDYYLLPLIEAYGKEKDFIDFSNLVHEKFIKPTFNTDIIKENLQGYRKNIIKSVETNPLLHFKRRGGLDDKK